MKEYKYDIYRYRGRYQETLKERILRPNELKYIIVYRKYHSSNRLVKPYYFLKMRRLKKKTFIQIPPKTKIGKGFYIGHCGRIIINQATIIGKNCNIATGVTIGQENRGRRKGCPVIGDSVWIGTNSAIVGNIKIGNDVLIAPLAYVNFDVPDHSIVIGNPGKIIPRKNATEKYIEKTV